MGSGFLKKRKQARAMQAEFGNLQDKLSKQLEQVEVVGSAGNGLVELTMNGSNELKKVKIKPECVDPEDIEGLELLIKTAHNDACQKLKDQSANSMGLDGMPDISSMLNL